MTGDYDSRLKYADKFGDKISLSELTQRWQANTKLINELAFAKKLTPYYEERIATVCSIESSTLFVFLRRPTRDLPSVIEDEQDTPKYKQLPDDAYFYWTDILEFEDKNPEIMHHRQLINDRQKAVAEIEASRTAAIMPIEALLEGSIADLLEEAKPKDDIHQHKILHTWIGALETEATRIGKVYYDNESERKKEVYNKIKEIEQYLKHDQTSTTSTIEYGEPEKLSSNTIGLYPALKILGEGWRAEELALNLLNNNIRAFVNKQKESNLVKPVLNISEWLKLQGKAEAFTGEITEIDKILLQFKYSKIELTDFKPDNRYISFNQAKDFISKQTGGVDRAQNFIISAISNNELSAWHPLVGAVTMEQSLNGERWQHCFFADWQLNKVLLNEFGCSFEKNLSATEITSMKVNNLEKKEIDPQNIASKLGIKYKKQSDIDELLEKTVSRIQIKKIFEKRSNEQWRGYFNREKDNRLGHGNIGEKGKPIYKLGRVCEWLTSKGYYTDAEIQTALKKYYNLPQETISRAHNKMNLGEQFATEDKQK